MRIYLDNNATTPIHPLVLERFERELRQTIGNASSRHQEAQRSRRTLEEAREAVASLLGAPSRQVVFTSGGTEANNLALFGAVGPDAKRCHIVTTSIEHPSVLEVVRQLERRGHEVTFVGCDAHGVISVKSTSVAAVARAAARGTFSVPARRRRSCAPPARCACSVKPART
jgi:cysteine desulfurase